MGKTFVILMAFGALSKAGVPANYTCDLCGFDQPRSKITMVSSGVMHRAILSGLNPFATPGIDSSNLLARSAGLRMDTLYSFWRDRSLQDPTPFGLCDRCFEVVNSFQTTKRKWWQLWRK
jgi:hypothetical protein